VRPFPSARSPEPQAGKDVEDLPKTFGNTTPEALDCIKKMLKGQGIG
jgi:hypothetical protein